MSKLVGVLVCITIINLLFISAISPIVSVTKVSHTIADSSSPAEMYTNYCAGCHGAKVEAFADFHHHGWKHGSSREDLFKGIKYGYEKEGMPGFDTTFTDKETDQLADYILQSVEKGKRYNVVKESQRQNRFESDNMVVKLDTVVRGINVAWGMVFLPNGDMLFTEREGKLFRVSKNRKIDSIAGVPMVKAGGQAGLLDIALHPKFNINKVLYLSYMTWGDEDKKTDNSTIAIMRAILKGNSLTEQKVIFRATPYQSGGTNIGSRIVFDKEGYLYFSVGYWIGNKMIAQYLSTDMGKIHRIKDDGSIPSDNPFVHIDTAKASIWSYGHRNPQGLVFNSTTGLLWEHEHGPRGGDEVNIIQKGKNYGWPVISYGINYNGVPITDKTAMEGMEQPQFYWIPSIAPCGMTFVTSNRYPEWKGDLLIGSLRFGYLSRCKIKNGKIVAEEMLLKNIGRLRDVRQGLDGYIYVSVERPGYIFRLIPVK